MTNQTPAHAHKTEAARDGETTMSKASPDYADHTRGMRKGLILAIAGVIIAGIVLGVLFGILRGEAGVLGVITGTAIGAVFCLLTAVFALATWNADFAVKAGVMLGGWILKVIVLLGVLALLKPLHYYDKTALGVSVLVALIVVLAGETIGILSTRATYVAPTRQN